MDFPLQSTFLALPLEGNLKWQFQALQEKLKPFEDCLRFQNPQTPHMTLQFWKELMEIEYGQIEAQAQKIALSTAPFTLKVDTVETFGDRVLLLSLAFSEELARLKKSCPWPDPKKFHPHITLARMGHPQRFQRSKKKIMKALADAAFEIPIDRLRLYAEIDGRKQTPLQDFVLQG